MKEIERKFLVDKNKWSPSGKGVAITQGYISDDPERTVRIRIAGDKSYLTIKGKSTGISRTEIEFEIPLKDANVLMEMAKNGLVQKQRYKEMVAGMLWEVDVFEDQNKGLVLAEIELDSESQLFKKPGWVVEEVSGDQRFFNLSLSKKPYNLWEG